MSHDKEYFQGVLFALVNCCSLATVGIIDKLVSSKYTDNPLLFSTQSLLFSFIFSVVFALIFFRGLPMRHIKELPVSTWRAAILVGIFGSGIFIFLRFLGLRESTGTFATLSQVISTSLTVLLAWVFFKERLSKISWLFFVAIVISIYFVSVGRIAFVDIRRGDLFIIFATPFLAIGNMFSKKAVLSMNPILLSVVRFFSGLIFLSVLSLLLLDYSEVYNLFNKWVILSGFLWFVSVTTFNLAIKKIGITLATSIIMMSAIIAMILEYYFLKVNFTTVQVIAGLIVVINGIAIIFANNTSKIKASAV